MRIRRCASRILGSTYAPAPPDTSSPRFENVPLPPPPPPARPAAATESRGGSVGFAAATASWDTCELSRSPWDVIAQFDLSDPQEEKNLVDSYFVHVAGQACWLLPTSLPAAMSVKEETAVAAVDENSTEPRHEVAKKPPAKKKMVKKKEGKEMEKEENKPRKKANVKKEESDGNAAGVAQIWTCKKNDGKRWFCQRQVSRPNSLCEYHFDQKRPCHSLFSEITSTAAPLASSSAASKPSTSSKARRKKSADAGEGFYYYTGFSPFRTKKRHCRSSSMHESAPAEQEEEALLGDSMHESAPAEQEEESPPGDSMHESARAEQGEEAPPEGSMHESAPTEQEGEALPEDHAAPTADQAQADDTDHRAKAHDDQSSRDDVITGIADSDEESSSNDTYGCIGGGKPRVVGVNGDIKRKSPWKKRWRKPVKARSLKSLM